MRSPPPSQSSAKDRYLRQTVSFSTVRRWRARSFTRRCRIVALVGHGSHGILEKILAIRDRSLTTSFTLTRLDWRRFALDDVVELLPVHPIQIS